MTALEIDRTWDGDPIDERERVAVGLQRREQGLIVTIHAPFHDDPAPPSPAGRCEKLWEFEVVELFLVGENRSYLELEFGPHGHYLALRFSAPRQLVDGNVAVEFEAAIRAGSWSGRAHVPCEVLPEPIRLWNAFAIHGESRKRRHLTAHPLGGLQPDFHRIDRFPEASVD